MPESPERAAPGVYRILASEVHELVFAHKGTNPPSNEYFGFPYDELSELLDNGRAEFSYDYDNEAYGRISAENLVLFYGHCMMKGHLFAARANLQHSNELITGMIAGASRVVVIDVGCGPGTAGLAFAECLPKIPFAYYGVDIAVAMRNKCRKVMQAAKVEGLAAAGTTIICKENWKDVPTTFGTRSAIILNFSYFFASKTLTKVDIASLVAFYKELVARNADSRVAISYTNSTNSLAADNYKKFLKGLAIEYGVDPPCVSTVEYYTTKGGASTKSTTFCHEIFEVVP